MRLLIHFPKYINVKKQKGKILVGRKHFLKVFFIVRIDNIISSIIKTFLYVRSSKQKRIRNLFFVIVNRFFPYPVWVFIFCPILVSHVTIFTFSSSSSSFSLVQGSNFLIGSLYTMEIGYIKIFCKYELYGSYYVHIVESHIVNRPSSSLDHVRI